MGKTELNYQGFTVGDETIRMIEKAKQSECVVNTQFRSEGVSFLKYASQGVDVLGEVIETGIFNALQDGDRVNA